MATMLTRSHITKIFSAALVIPMLGATRLEGASVLCSSPDAAVQPEYGTGNPDFSVGLFSTTVTGRGTSRAEGGSAAFVFPGTECGQFTALPRLGLTSKALSLSAIPDAHDVIRPGSEVDSSTWLFDSSCTITLRCLQGFSGQARTLLGDLAENQLSPRAGSLSAPLTATVGIQKGSPPPTGLGSYTNYDYNAHD